HRVLHCLGHCEMLYLRIVEHLINIVNGPARYPGLIEESNQLLTEVTLRIRLDGRIERIAVLRARGAVRIARVTQELLCLDSLAEPLPDGLAGRGNIDVAIPGLKHASRNTGGMIIAGLRRDLVLHEPARRLEIQHKNLRLQQRGLDPLAL